MWFCVAVLNESLNVLDIKFIEKDRISEWMVKKSYSYFLFDIL